MSSSHTTETTPLLGHGKHDLTTHISPPPSGHCPPVPAPPSSSNSAIKLPIAAPSSLSPTPSSESNESAGSSGSLDMFDSLLRRISPESIVAMALRIYREWSTLPSANKVTCTLVSPPLCGSFNLVHVLDFSNGVKWALRLPLKDPGARRLESEVMTMNFIRKNTTIPIPDIIYFDSTTENEITWPYTMMQFDEGTAACQIWWDNTGPTPLEERRHRILDSVASAMSQLARFKFNKIGCLEFQGDPRLNSSSPRIGPLNIIDQQEEMRQLETEEDTGAMFKTIGPFDSSREYMLSLLDAQEVEDDSFSIGINKLLRIMINNLPLSPSGNESFELTHPDFGGQNFLVSENGTLTAIIDWDNVQTVPEWIGCCSYPAWLTHDWDPLMYRYPQSPCENSPEELDGYRKYYSEKMASLGSTRFTTKSHIYEAIHEASSNPICTDGIVYKIFYHMFPGGELGEAYNPDTPDLGEVTEALAEGGLEKYVEDKILCSIQELLSLPGQASTTLVPRQFAGGAKLWQFIRRWTGTAQSFSFSIFIRARGVAPGWRSIVKFFRGTKPSVDGPMI